MKTRKETISFEKIKAQTKELHQLSFQLRMKLLSNLGVLHSSNTFNKSRQRAVENISSKTIVLNEVDFMRDAVSLYSNELLSFEERRDPLYSHVVLNEYRYLEFWVNNPDMKEIAINDEAVSFLATRVNDLNLPNRIKNVLKAADFYHVYHMVEYEEKDFLKYRNMGKGAIREMEECLISHNLHFGMHIRYDEQSKSYFTLE